MEETPLCTIMKKHGSDKGQDRHNYTITYHKLFKNKRTQITNIFEIGIGSTNPQIPSSMGPNGTPKASLRGWSEYFPNATIHGADIDETILKNEEKIQTHYVDQNNPTSIQEMWNSPSLQNQTFDIIIDDAQHNHQANITFLNNSLQKLKPDGTYIIEDINTNPQNIQQYQTTLNQNKNINYQIHQIPHPTNNQDNCIITITRKNAIILIGQVKNFHPLAQNFHTNIHQHLHQTSHYILLTSKNTTYTNPRQNENHPIDHTTILQHINFTKEIYDGLEEENTPLSQQIHQQTQHLINTYGGAWEQHSTTSTNNALKLLYSLNLLYHTLQDQKNHYNKYIIIRSDIHQDTPFNPEWLQNTEDATLPKFASYGGYNDRYAILNPKAYTSYCSRYQKITQNPQHLHSETYLKQTLTQDNITVKEEKEIKFRLLRSDGNLSPTQY